MKKKYTLFRPRLRSRHPSHNILREHNKNLPLLPFRSLVRLGSTTELKEAYMEGRIVVNTVEAISNSSNKLRMKTCFSKNSVKTADWWIFKFKDDFDKYYFDKNLQDDNFEELEDLPFPIISKSLNGSRGRGNKKHDSVEDLRAWLDNKSNLDNYIFEKYYNYNREYRLHVTEEGCFYSCRKMLKTDAPTEVRWYRNNDHCNWIMEENDLFDKPINWTDIEKECIKALKSVKLDVGAIDLRIQSATNKDGDIRESPEFIIIEINSAPSFGKVTEQKYLKIIPEILRKKNIINEQTRETNN